jgi:hypothetical protein
MILRSRDGSADEASGFVRSGTSTARNIECVELAVVLQGTNDEQTPHLTIFQLLPDFSTNPSVCIASRNACSSSLVRPLYVDTSMLSVVWIRAVGRAPRFVN